MIAFKDLPNDIQEKLILLECRTLLRHITSENTNDWQGLEGIFILYDHYTFFANDTVERSKAMDKLVHALLVEAKYRCEQLSIPERAYLPESVLTV